MIALKTVHVKALFSNGKNWIDVVRTIPRGAFSEVRTIPQVFHKEVIDLLYCWRLKFKF